MNAIGRDTPLQLNSTSYTHGDELLIIDKPILDELSDSALKQLSHRYAKTANFISTVLAERIKRQHNSAAFDQAHTKAMSAAQLMAIKMETFGFTYDQALATIAQESGLDRDHLAGNFRTYMKGKNTLSRHARDAVILRLAQSKTNAEISNIVGLSPGRISQLIAEHFRKPD